MCDLPECDMAEHHLQLVIDGETRWDGYITGITLKEFGHSVDGPDGVVPMSLQMVADLSACPDGISSDNSLLT